MFRAWPQEDQDEILGYRRQLKLACPGCRTQAEEWEADRFAYVADQRHCPGCEVIEMEKDNVREGAKGVHVVLLPRHVSEARDAAESDSA